MPGRRVRATRCQCLNWKPGKEVVEPTPCQESRVINVETELDLPPRVSNVEAEVILPRRFISVETQVSLPLAPSSDTAPEQPVAECHRAQEDAVGIYCGTLLSAWRMQAKAGTEEDDKGALEMSFHVNMMNSDWALKSLGATIDMKRTSPTYRCGWKWGYSLLLNRRCTEDEPDTILQMDVSQGKRWCFPGHSGHVVIRLPARVHLTAIAVQHIVEEDSLSVAASSAPKGLAVYGFEAESEEETWLGSFIYDVAKESIQPFSLKVECP
ncbi:SUN domain-containing protein 3-like isoform X1 [Colius striatus]|uniref:SUN domain-containing protein 3-like isoform X1 n=1 Tax=Colius striatus TaxID=57412 RepID=UPI002B1E22C5|nr:SUN domain-containing protein 3-like isoform X1 [Colius striatus]